MELKNYGQLYKYKESKRDFFTELEKYKYLSKNSSEYVSDDMIQKIREIEINKENPKIDINKIIETLDLQLKEVAMPKSGEINNKSINIKNDLDEKEKELVKAHEVIHYLLGDREATRDFHDTKPSDIVKENLIDKLALKLLLPETLVYSYINYFLGKQHHDSNSFKLGSLLMSMSAKLNLPVDVINYRLKELNVFDLE